MALSISDQARRELRKRLPIVDFLRERGIHAARVYGNKAVYSCPVHQGDSTPSFYVYTQEDNSQDCFCFGCKFSGDIVSLKAKLDHIGHADAFEYLASKIGFDVNNPDAVLDDCLMMLSEVDAKKDTSEKMCSRLVELTSQYRALWLAGCDVSALDSKWQSIDEAIKSGNADEVRF